MQETRQIRVFDYLDYRQFIRDYHEARRKEKPHFSLRYLAGKSGVSPALLSRVLKGQRNLNPEAAARLASALGLQNVERDFFEALVLFGTAKSHTEKSHFLEKILRIRATKVHTLAAHQADYFRTWYHSAVRELLNFYPFDGDYQKLARMLRPAITAPEAKKTLQLLLDCGLVEKRPDGSYQLVDKVVSSGDHIQATLVNDLHINMAELAIRAVREVSPRERDFSSLTLSLSPHCLEAVKAKLRKFRKEILEMARQDTDVDGVYQMNFQVFPLSQRHPAGNGA